jgi:hypothetical protein
VVLEHPRSLEPARVDRVVTRVPDQLLGDLPHVVVGAVEICRRDPLASPPPTFPLPITAIFMESSNDDY